MGIRRRPTVITDSQVLFAQRYRRFRHLTDRGLTVTPGTMDVENATEIIGSNQPRQLALPGGLNLTTIFPQFWLDILHAQRPIKICLIGATDQLISLEDTVFVD